MASLDMTSGDAGMKQLYKPKNFVTTTLDRRPMIGSLPKDETFFGRNMPLVNQYGNPQGVSADFATAQAVTTAAKLEDFLLTRVNEHSVATIDGETLDAMSNNSGAFVTAMKVQVDSAMNALSDRLESLVPGSNTGVLGQISAGSNVATASVTLADPADITKFEVGMSVVASVADGGALRSAGVAEVIKSVDRRSGILGSTSVAWNTVIGAIAASDFLYAKGDAKNNGTAKVTAGFAAWLPSTAPTGGESFFGTDRSVDTRLYGNFFDGSSTLIEPALIEGMSIASVEGGKPDTGFIHHTKMRKLVKEIGSKEYYTKAPARGVGGKLIAEVSYDGVVIRGDSGVATMMAANKIPSDTAYLLEISTWLYGSIGPLVKWNTAGAFNPNGILRQGSADGVEARLVHRGNVGCLEPSRNCRVKLA